jgi:hypothetical protein
VNPAKMDSSFRCCAGDCIRPACSRLISSTITSNDGGLNGMIDENKLYCYYHVACSTDSKNQDQKIDFFDIKTAKKQATEFRNVATQVWEDLVEELEEADGKRRKREKLQQEHTQKVKASTEGIDTVPSSRPGVKSGDSKSKREMIWDLTPNKGGSTMTSSRTSDILSSKSDIPCQFCHSRNTVTYRCISAAIDAAKADTWGSSNRPDRVLKYTCSNCKKSWLVEEG